MEAVISPTGSIDWAKTTATDHVISSESSCKFFNNDNKKEQSSAVAIGTFDGVHCGHIKVLDQLLASAQEKNERSVVILFKTAPKGIVNHVLSQTEQKDTGIKSTESSLTAAKTCEKADEKKEKRKEDSLSFASNSYMHDLTSVRQRLEKFLYLGIDEVIIVQFTEEFMRQTYQAFLDDLVKNLHMKTLVLGEDARLGWKGAGNSETITQYSQEVKTFEVRIVNLHGPGFVEIPQKNGNFSTSNPVSNRSTSSLLVSPTPSTPSTPSTSPPHDVHNGVCANRGEVSSHENSCLSPTYSVRVWSSSNIRYLLSEGRIREVTAILGHYPLIEGEIVTGDEEGRKLGFPTANFSLETEGFIPADGVYSGWLLDCGLQRNTTPTSNEVTKNSPDSNFEEKYAPYNPLMTYPAAISIGTKPTFYKNLGMRVVETYALAPQWLDLYGHHVKVLLLSRLRSQERFENIEELIAQIKLDVEQVYKETAQVESTTIPRYLG